MNLYIPLAIALSIAVASPLMYMAIAETPEPSRDACVPVELCNPPSKEPKTVPEIRKENIIDADRKLRALRDIQRKSQEPMPAPQQTINPEK